MSPYDLDFSHPGTHQAADYWGVQRHMLSGTTIEVETHLLYSPSAYRDTNGERIYETSGTVDHRWSLRFIGPAETHSQLLPEHLAETEIGLGGPERSCFSR